jgi:dihydrolipoamide dehydrogenase
MTEAEARADPRRVVATSRWPSSPSAPTEKLPATVIPPDSPRSSPIVRTGNCFGAHLVGADVAELLPELTLAQRWDLTVEELVRNVHTHPTLSEALQETFHGLAGKMINF